MEAMRQGGRGRGVRTLGIGLVADEPKGVSTDEVHLG